MLVDDEELEMRELRAGPNPLTCSDHLGASGLRGCSLCRGWFDINLEDTKDAYIGL